EFFLQEIWPRLEDLQPVLHVIAGARHEYYLNFYRKRIEAPRLELEGFVGDVRPAYARASVVIAPLTASAGTNIKILEAMAMGKAIVSTPAGVNGLDLIPREHYLLTQTAAERAAAIEQLFANPGARTSLEANAR